MSAADGCAIEDPYLFLDRQQRWHIIFHAFDASKGGQRNLVSLHLFSRDGVGWKASASPPFTNEVQWAAAVDNSSIVANRERPKLVIGKSGIPTHLVTAVCSVADCGAAPPVACKMYFHDYTLVTPLKIN